MSYGKGAELGLAILLCPLYQVPSPLVFGLDDGIQR